MKVPGERVKDMDAIILTIILTSLSCILIVLAMLLVYKRKKNYLDKNNKTHKGLTDSELERFVDELCESLGSISNIAGIDRENKRLKLVIIDATLLNGMLLGKLGIYGAVVNNAITIFQESNAAEVASLISQRISLK